MTPRAHSLTPVLELSFLWHSGNSLLMLRSQVSEVWGGKCRELTCQRSSFLVLTPRNGLVKCFFFRGFYDDREEEFHRFEVSSSQSSQPWHLPSGICFMQQFFPRVFSSRTLLLKEFPIRERSLYKGKNIYHKNRTQLHCKTEWYFNEDWNLSEFEHTFLLLHDFHKILFLSILNGDHKALKIYCCPQRFFTLKCDPIGYVPLI